MRLTQALHPLVLAGIAAALMCASLAARGDTPFALPPLPLPGPYPVACSNVMQDFNRVPPGTDVEDYWDGVLPNNGSPRYVTDLLSDSAHTLAVNVAAPNDGNLYGSFAGKSLPYVVLVCYPTTPANSRPDYALPTGHKVPHMQRAAEAPLLPDAATRYPVMLFSHGYGGSPLSGDYIDALLVFASFGYVVAAPFHGDFRFSNLEVANLSNLFYALTHIRDFTAMQALRPLSLSATIDLLLSHPQWRDHVDPARIGGFGASQGGESLLLMAGAGLTTSVGQSWSTVTHDPRLKAAVGYIPYFGQPVLPAFGRDQRGLDGVTLPYLAISGTADTTAPIELTLPGVARLAAPRELVALTGVKHGFDVAFASDIFTWSVTFLDANVRDDPVARENLLQATSVAGGGDDHVLIPYTATVANNFGGLWWNAPAGSESGWGINIAHQGDVIFATWLTYDLTGKAWWLSMTGTKASANTYTGTLYETHGPAFNAVPFDPARVTLRAVGSGTLSFSDAGPATFAYVVNGVAQTKLITREAFARPVPACTFGAPVDLASVTNYQDIWWNAPAGSESGWGLNLTHQGEIIFAVWFTYDLDGTPLWLSATLNRTAGSGYGGTLYRTRGPPFNAVPFDPMAISRTAVGQASLVFADGNNGSFSYNVNGIAQTKAITRQVFRTPGTLCR